MRRLRSRTHAQQRRDSLALGYLGLKPPFEGGRQGYVPAAGIGTSAGRCQQGVCGIRGGCWARVPCSSEVHSLGTNGVPLSGRRHFRAVLNCAVRAVTGCILLSQCSELTSVTEGTRQTQEWTLSEIIEQVQMEHPRAGAVLAGRDCGRFCDEAGCSLCWELGAAGPHQLSVSRVHEGVGFFRSCIRKYRRSEPLPWEEA